MADKTESGGTSVSNPNQNNWLTEDATFARMKDLQTCDITGFNSLSFPSGAVIVGIEVRVLGYEGTAQPNWDASGNYWISVSNDGGTTFSSKKGTGGNWGTNAGTAQTQTAGGSTDLWGMTWNATTAAAIQTRFGWSGNPGIAVFADYVSVRIHYNVPKNYNKSEITSGTVKFTSGNIVFK